MRPTQLLRKEQLLMSMRLDATLGVEHGSGPRPRFAQQRAAREGLAEGRGGQQV